MFGMQRCTDGELVLVQSGTVSVQRCSRASGGTRCNFEESAADVGNSRVCPLALFVHTRPHGSGSSSLLFVRFESCQLFGSA